MVHLLQLIKLHGHLVIIQSPQLIIILKKLLCVRSIKNKIKIFVLFTFTYSSDNALPLFLWIWVSDITFPFSLTTSFNISCKAGLLATNSLNFCSSKKNFPLHFSRIISQGTEFWTGDISCLFQHFTYFTLFFSGLGGCWEAAEYNSHLYSSRVWYFFPLASFNIFSLYFITGTWANEPLVLWGKVGVGWGSVL